MNTFTRVQQTPFIIFLQNFSPPHFIFLQIGNVKLAIQTIISPSEAPNINTHCYYRTIPF